MPEIAAPPPPPRSASLAGRVLPAIGLVLALVVGAWFIGAAVPDYAASIVLTGAWFVGVGVAAEFLSRRRPHLRLPLRGAFLVVLAVSAFGFYWTSVRDDVVDETVVAGVAASSLPTTQATGEPAAEDAPTGKEPVTAPPAVNVTESTGAFESLAHPASGTASVVRLPDGGRVLTLTDFRTDNGPDLRVYLVAGSVNDNGDGDGSVDLGTLKGNIGDQQYAIPEGTDLARHATVVIWCRAFTVGFGKAVLRAA